MSITIRDLATDPTPGFASLRRALVREGLDPASADFIVDRYGDAIMDGWMRMAAPSLRLDDELARKLLSQVLREWIQEEGPIPRGPDGGLPLHPGWIRDVIFSLLLRQIEHATAELPEPAQVAAQATLLEPEQVQAMLAAVWSSRTSDVLSAIRQEAFRACDREFSESAWLRGSHLQLRKSTERVLRRWTGARMLRAFWCAAAGGLEIRLQVRRDPRGWSIRYALSGGALNKKAHRVKGAPALTRLSGAAEIASPGRAPAPMTRASIRLTEGDWTLRLAHGAVVGLFDLSPAETRSLPLPLRLRPGSDSLELSWIDGDGGPPCRLRTPGWGTLTLRGAGLTLDVDGERRSLPSGSTLALSELPEGGWTIGGEGQAEITIERPWVHRIALSGTRAEALLCKPGASGSAMSLDELRATFSHLQVECAPPAKRLARWRAALAKIDADYDRGDLTADQAEGACSKLGEAPPLEVHQGQLAQVVDAILSLGRPVATATLVAFLFTRFAGRHHAGHHLPEARLEPTTGATATGQHPQGLAPTDLTHAQVYALMERIRTLVPGLRSAEAVCALLIADPAWRALTSELPPARRESLAVSLARDLTA